MKHYFKSIFGIAISLLAVSCAKTELSEVNETEKQYEYVFTLSSADTKTSLNDKVVEWETGDKLGFFADGSENKYGNVSFKDGKAQIPIYLAKALSAGAKVYSYFPFKDEQTSVSSLKFTIPSEQNGNFDAMPQVSLPYTVSEAMAIGSHPVEDMRFCNLASVAQIKIYNTNPDYSAEKISSVKFEADQAIAGDISGFNATAVDYSNPETLSIGGYEETSVSYSLSTPTTVAATKDNATALNLVVAPGTYGGKIIVTTDKATYSYEVTEEKKLSFNRSVIKPISIDLKNGQRAVAVDYVTLPFEWAGGSSADFASIKGVTLSGNGSDYTNTHAPYYIKFDSSNDYFTIKTDSPVDVLSIGVKMIGGANTSYLTVSGSADGENYTQVEKLTISGSQNNIKTLTTKETFNSSYRYIKVVFTKGSNIGVGPVSITKGVLTCMTPTLATGSEPAGAVLIGTVIKLDCATEGATIYYTTNGTMPSTSSDEYTDDGITINEACTIKAYAVKTDFVDSDVLSISYTIKVVETPEISISDDGKATIDCEEDATVYYTLDGTDPTDAGLKYTEPVQLEDNQTIKAIAYKANMMPSEIASATYESGQYTITFDTEIENGSISVNGNETGSIKVTKGETVTIVATPGDYCEFVEWTITPSVTFASGSATSATAIFAMPENAIEVSAIFMKKEATAPVALYDFSKIEGLNSWGSSYSNHVVEYTDATVTFSAASKQTTSITDVPVTKGSEITVVMKNNTVIKSLNLLTKQWTDKVNDVTLNTSTDGGITFTPTSSIAGAGTILSASNLNGVNAIKFTFSSQGDQIGIAALALNGAELPKKDASITFNPSSISVEVGKTKDFTYTAVYDGTLNIQSNNTDVATISKSSNTITVTGVSEGKTTISFKGDATAQYNAIDKSIDVEVVASGQGGDSYTITFATGSGDGTQASTSTACSTVVSEGSDYLSGNLATATRVYYSGGSGLKLGASSNAGTIKMNLSTAGQVTPKSIVVNAKLYNSGKATTLKVNGSAAQNLAADFADYTYIITSKITYIELVSSKYCWIKSVTVNY